MPSTTFSLAGARTGQAVVQNAFEQGKGFEVLCVLRLHSMNSARIPH